MKNNVLLLIFSVLLFSCKNEMPDASWLAFTKCGSNNCVKEAIAVKEAFLKNPKKLLTDFQATAAKGEDHLIGWLYIMLDSVLTNPKMGELQKRIDMKQAIIDAAKPLANDTKVMDSAKAIIEEMENIAMMAETEDAQDDTILDNLIGDWVSVTDKKAGLKITKDSFEYIYSGKPTEPKLTYSYQAHCPKDCNPIDDMPCLKVTGQDDVCYSVVTADSTTLAISQIGGTGNTNTYKRIKK